MAAIILFSLQWHYSVVFFLFPRQATYIFYILYHVKDVKLIIPDTTMTGTRNNNNGFYYMDLQSIEPSPVPHIPQHSPCSNNVQTLSTKSYIVQYFHQSDFSPAVSTWTTVITSGFFTTWTGLTSALFCKHLPKILATAKGHLLQDLITYDPPKTLLPPLPSPICLLWRPSPLLCRNLGSEHKWHTCRRWSLQEKWALTKPDVSPSPLPAVANTSWSYTTTKVTPS